MKRKSRLLLLLLLLVRLEIFIVLSELSVLESQ
jgi:hypothetical protein